MFLPAELVERANRPRRPIRGDRIGMSSFQTHKILIKEDGTKVRVMRNMGSPDDIPLLGKDIQNIRIQYGAKALKVWLKGRSEGSK